MTLNPKVYIKAAEMIKADRFIHSCPAVFFLGDKEHALVYSLLFRDKYDNDFPFWPGVDKEFRLTALCLMAAMVEAGDELF